MLLGLIREGSGIAAGVLASLGIRLEKVRSEVLYVLSPSARVLREELESRLRRLKDLETGLKQSAGTDNREQIRADAVAIAIEHLQQAIDALEVASRE